MTEKSNRETRRRNYIGSTSASSGSREMAETNQDIFGFRDIHHRPNTGALSLYMYSVFTDTTRTGSSYSKREVYVMILICLFSPFIRLHLLLIFFIASLRNNKKKIVRTRTYSFNRSDSSNFIIYFNTMTEQQHSYDDTERNNEIADDCSVDSEVDIDDGWSIGIYDHQEIGDDDEYNTETSTLGAIGSATTTSTGSRMSHDLTLRNTDDNDCVDIESEKLRISRLNIGRLLKTNMIINASMISSNCMNNDDEHFDIHDGQDATDEKDTKQSQNRMDTNDLQAALNSKYPSNKSETTIRNSVRQNVACGIVQTNVATGFSEERSTTGSSLQNNDSSNTELQNTPKLHPSNSFYYSVCSRSSSCLSLDDCNRIGHTGSIADLLSFYDSARSDSPSALSSTTLLQSLDQTGQQHLVDCVENEVKSPTRYCELEAEQQKQQHAHLNENNSCLAGTIPTASTTTAKTPATISSTQHRTSLHHDLLMHILSFLDLESLNSFSETGRRPNGECYYFIRLQLQHVLRLAKSTMTGSVDSIGCNDYLINGLPDLQYLYRFAVMDFDRTEAMIQTLYNNLPFQQSTIRRSRYYNSNTAKMAAAAAAGSAAFVMACMGMAAAYGAHTSVTASSTHSLMTPLPTMIPSSTSTMEEWDEYTTAMTAFMKVIGVFGSIAAAKTMATVSTLSKTTVGDTGVAPIASESKSKDNSAKDRHVRWNFSRNRETSTTSSNTTLLENFPLLLNDLHRYPDPYQHHAQITKDNNTINTSALDEDKDELNPPPCANTMLTMNKANGPSLAVLQPDELDSSNKDRTSTNSKVNNNDQFYVGSVGAYKRIVKAAKREITLLIRQERRENYHSIIDEVERRSIVTTFMLAVIANDLPIVKRYINTIDIDLPYPIQPAMGNGGGNDNIITMLPVHAAAFYGADQVLEFLCQGIDSNPKLKVKQSKRRKSRKSNNERMESMYDYVDGGLVSNINQQDPTGWTLLHFAAGSNNTNAVRMLLYSYNADPSIEADNGYTPYQWARRLQHDDVMVVFQTYYTQQHQDTFSNLLRRHIF
jgi:Ankyrin repeat